MVTTQRLPAFVTRLVMLFNINENSTEVKTISKYIFGILPNMLRRQRQIEFVISFVRQVCTHLNEILREVNTKQISARTPKRFLIQGKLGEMEK